jgi:hypothetical protein
MRQPRSAYQCEGMARKRDVSAFHACQLGGSLWMARGTTSTLNAGVETQEGSGLQSEGAEDSGIKCFGRKHYQRNNKVDRKQTLRLLILWII